MRTLNVNIIDSSRRSLGCRPSAFPNDEVTEHFEVLVGFTTEQGEIMFAAVTAGS